MKQKQRIYREGKGLTPAFFKLKMSTAMEI